MFACLSGVGLLSPSPHIFFFFWEEGGIISSEGGTMTVVGGEIKSSHSLLFCDLRQGKTTLPPRCRKCHNIQKSSGQEWRIEAAGRYMELLTAHVLVA